MQANTLLHSIPKAGETLSGLSRYTIYTLLKQKKLEARKVGRRTFIVDASLRQFIDELPRYAA